MSRRILRACAVLSLALAACGDVKDPGAEPDAGIDDRNDGGVDPADAGPEADAMPDPLDPAALAVDRTSNDFGDLLQGGRSATARFVVSNTGEETSGALATAVTGDGGEFELGDDCDGERLAAGESCEVAVTFAPAAVGEARATVRIESSPGGAVEVAVSGTALTPGALELDDPDHDFGRVAVGDRSAVKTFVVENTGDVATGPVTLTNSAADTFAVTRDDCSGAALAARATCTIDVEAQPDAVGSATASLTISASPGGNAVASLGTTGTAVVTVRRAGSGSGAVTSTPGGIDCGTTCTEEFASAAVTLRASAAGGSVFTGWAGACTGTGSCALDLDGDAAVSARFEAMRALEVQVRGDGQVTSSPGGISCGSDCSESFVNGTTVTLTASPGTGSRFAGWSGCPSASGATCTATLTAAMSIGASFELVPRALDVTTSGNGRGTVTSSPAGIDCGRDCGHEYDHGTSVTLTANPATGSRVDGWTGCDTTSGASCTVTMDRARSVDARFALETRGLRVSPLGTGTGGVSSSPAGISCGNDCDHDYDYGTTVTLTASADRASVFAGWTGCTSSARTTCTVLMTAARDVTATFNQLSHRLSVSTSGAGTVTSAPAGIDCGNDCTEDFVQSTIVVLTAAPSSGWIFDGWTGCDSVAGNECKVEMSSARSVSASFTRLGRFFTLEVVRTGNGRGTVVSNPAGIDCGTTCAGSFVSGSRVEITARPSRGSTFVGWSGGGCGRTSTCTVSMTQSHQVKAVFDPIFQ